MTEVGVAVTDPPPPTPENFPGTNAWLGLCAIDVLTSPSNLYMTAKQE